MKPLFAGLALGTLLSTSALAADLTINTPAPNYPDTPVYSDPGIDWTGFYAGVVGGYGFGDSDGTTAGTTTTIDTDGLMGGVTVGGNMQYDQFVFGLEGDVLLNGQDGSTTCTGSAATCSSDYNWNGSLRARAGYAIDPVLIYATGGLAMAGIDTTVAPAAAGTTGSYSDTYYGWTLGGGVEAAVTEQLSAKAEYTYTDFGDQTAPAGTLGPAATTVSPTSHAIKVGLNFRF